MSKDDGDREAHLWTWVLHEDNLFVNRSSFFVVAQSMLFAGFAQLVAGSNTYASDFSVQAFCLIGIFFAAIWVYTSYAQIYFTMRPLKKQLREITHDYATVAQNRRRLPSLNFVLGLFCPLVVVFAWGALLAKYTKLI